jgi:PLP dependent protein
MTDQESFSTRLLAIQERIAAACAKAGRRPDDVQLLAVSKSHPPETITEAVSHGLTIFGESKIQEARAKIPLCPSMARWHMIGHMQTNKIKYAVHLFEAVHSVDSLRVLEALAEAASAAGRDIQVFLEVNVSGESSKYGLAPDDVPALLERSTSIMSVSVVGLMTMPPFSEDPEKTRVYFATLREWRDRWRVQTGIPLDQLSMGMSHDLDVAVEEGATWVRVGTALFGSR